MTPCIFSCARRIDAFTLVSFFVPHNDDHASFFKSIFDDFQQFFQRCTAVSSFHTFPGASQSQGWGESSHARAWQPSDDFDASGSIHMLCSASFWFFLLCLETVASWQHYIDHNTTSARLSVLLVQPLSRRSLVRKASPSHEEHTHN